MITSWLIFIGLLFLIPTAYAGYIGAPYAPTRIAPVKKAFALLGLGKDDVVLDLGAGDGKIMFEAVRVGARAIGYELSPILYIVAFLRLVGQKNARLSYGNFFKKPISDATVIFIFLMPAHMEQVRAFIAKGKGKNLQYILSYAFPFKDITPVQVIREKNCAPLYIYEAQLF